MKTLYWENKNLDLHKTWVISLSHSLYHGAKIVFKLLFLIFDDVIRLEFKKSLCNAMLMRKVLWFKLFKEKFYEVTVVNALPMV